MKQFIGFTLYIIAIASWGALSVYYKVIPNQMGLYFWGIATTIVAYIGGQLRRG